MINKNNEIETNRLIIKPCSNNELENIIENEKSEELKEAYSRMLQCCLENPEIRVWFTVWNMYLKNEPDTVIGNLGFKGISTDGVVEIGYGISEGWGNQGFMTEAVIALSDWAYRQNGVTKVEAETTEDNIASKKVLLKSGFIPNGIIGEEGPRYIFDVNRISKGMSI